jgi:hypothetical protein
MKILLISQIQPAEGTASAELLKRHLNRDGISYHGVDESHRALVRSTFDYFLLKGLGFISDKIRQFYLESIEPLLKARKIASTLGTDKYDLVVSLAHGRLGLHAWRVGKLLGIPTVTIFHDWWPEMMEGYRGTRDIVVRGTERDFRLAAGKADICLSICPGMARHINQGMRAKTLYPIADARITPAHYREPVNPLSVTYSGSLWNPYGAMLSELAFALEKESVISFKMHGDTKYFSEPKRIQLIEKGFLKSFIPEGDYIRCIRKESDVLLAVMGQDATGKCRMATSFPSKVANYFQTGNAVLLWALEGSSLEEFSREYDYPWVVTRDDPGEVVQMLKRLASDASSMLSARADALRIRDLVFNEPKIQHQFENALRTAINNHKAR